MLEPILSFDGDNRWLSNFYDHVVDLGGRMFASAEHAYQATKTLDEDEQRAVQLCRSPGAAKRMGRKVTLRRDWEASKVDMMRLVVASRFPVGGSLVPRLLATGDRVLVEGNAWGDRFWGATWEPLWACGTERAWANRRIGAATDVLVGRNQLGLLLMQRRAELAGA